MSTTTSPQELSPEEYIRTLPGLVATVCTTGLVQPEYGQALQDLRSYNDRNDIHKVEYQVFDAKLVEAGRDMAAKHALDNKYAWILQIDADAAPFQSNALEVLLLNAFVEYPHLDVVGAYAQLNADLPLPTIDTGTGTWEIHFPGEGILPVIRTGGHFFLTKVQAFHKMGPPPWFRTRRAIRPVEAMREIDSFARCKLNGSNPFWRTPEWISLYRSAIDQAEEVEAHVGEDSGFCDRLTSSGGLIAVNTNVVTGHVVKDTVTATKLREEMKRRWTSALQMCGVEEL
jgi:hypothetical protein